MPLINNCSVKIIILIQKKIILLVFYSKEFLEVQRTSQKAKRRCRTTKVNSVFRYIAQLVRDVAKIKMGESKLIFDIPHLVAPVGIEPTSNVQETLILSIELRCQFRNLKNTLLKRILVFQISWSKLFIAIFYERFSVLTYSV